MIKVSNEEIRKLRLRWIENGTSISCYRALCPPHFPRPDEASWSEFKSGINEAVERLLKLHSPDHPPGISVWIFGDIELPAIQLQHSLNGLESAYHRDDVNLYHAAFVSFVAARDVLLQLCWEDDFLSGASARLSGESAGRPRGSFRNRVARADALELKARCEAAGRRVNKSLIARRVAKQHGVKERTVRGWL